MWTGVPVPNFQKTSKWTIAKREVLPHLQHLLSTHAENRRVLPPQALLCRAGSLFQGRVAAVTAVSLCRVGCA